MIQIFKAQLKAGEGRTMSARAIPFGEIIDHKGSRVVFDAGSVTVPDGVVPLTVDHEGGSVDRIGKLERWFEDDGAGYAEFTVSETSLGSDILTLMQDGVLTDVSIGVAVDEAVEFTDDDGVLHRAGILDHVSIVGKGAFSPAKVLAVHEKEPRMADKKVTEAVVESYDDADLVAEIVTLSEKIDKLEASKVVKEPEIFRDMREFILCVSDAAKGSADSIEKLAKSDAYEVANFVMSADDTTTAAGLVPDFLSSQILGLLEGSRPTVEAFGKIDAGNTGMSVVLPNVTTKAVVAAQSSEHDQPNSTEMVIATKSFDLETYAGANRVSMQLVERSTPAFVDRLFAELASSYATVTDKAFNDAILAGVGTNTAILADFSADDEATFAAIMAGVTAIAGDIKRPADRLIVATNIWAEIVGLLDSTGRPLVLPAEHGPTNATGIASGDAWKFTYFPGLLGIHDPHAATDSCIIAWSGAASTIETSPQQLTAIQVDSLSMDFGIWGLFTDALLYAGNVGGLYSITAS